MANIFVSYGSDDRARVRTLATFLADNGHEVWWDRELIAGTDFADEIDRQLKKADLIIVCWSARSVASNWVKSEANEGMRTDRLLPLTLDGTPGPRPFDQLTTLDVSKWSDDNGAQLLKAVGDLPKHPAMSAFKKARQRARIITTAGVVGAGLVIAALWGPLSTMLSPPTANAITAYEKPRISEAATRHILSRLDATGLPTEDATAALIRTGDVLDAIELLELKLRDMGSDPPKEEERALLHQIGALAYDYDPAKAHGVYQALLVSAEEDTLALEQSGKLFRNNGQVEQAEQLFKDAIALIDGQSSERALDFQLLLNHLKLHKGEIRSSVEDAERLIVQAKETASDKQLATASRYAAMANFVLGSNTNDKIVLQTALDHIDRSIGIRNDTGDQAELASDLVTKGLIYYAMGQVEHARKSYTKSLDLSEKLELPLSKNLAISNLARLVTDLGDYSEAERLYREGLHYNTQYHIPHLQSGLFLGLAHLAKRRGDDQVDICKHFANAKIAVGNKFHSSLKGLEDEYGCA